MHVFTTIRPLQEHIQTLRAAGKTIGLVPTMGALHEGHLALLRQCRHENDVTVCSIYVNPTQFNNPDDLKKYPRPHEADRQLLEITGCDVLFMPGDEEMYPQPGRTRFDFGAAERVLEGQYRPGHFNGVGIVVSKLFHIVGPHTAYFGQKDLQQFVIIQQLVRDLSFPLKLVCHPIVREADGLAMSSRNRRLTPEQRQIAPILYQTLLSVRNLIQQAPVPEVIQSVNEHLSTIPGLQVEYFAVVDSQTLENVEDIHQHPQVSLCIAAYVGDIRLIDNLFLFS